MKAKLFAMALALTTLLGAQHAEGCSRVLYVGSDSLRIVGRSLDWKTPIPTNIYVYPRGIKKPATLCPDLWNGLRNTALSTP